LADANNFSEKQNRQNDGFIFFLWFFKRKTCFSVLSEYIKRVMRQAGYIFTLANSEVILQVLFS